MAWDATSVRVVDGDTLEIAGTTYRLFGIDAPEAGQTCAKREGGTWPCGKRATAALEDLVLGAEVACDDRGKDDYGRVLAVCVADGVEINAELVRRGAAFSFRRYAHDYDALEDEVRASGIGVFQAETETPWDYRARRWADAGSDAPDPACPIKGNISRKGERIYHAPWSPWYDKTKVNEPAGERWFCDEAEALAAGWRAPYWGR